MSFHSLKLDASILKALEEAGLKIPTPIQEQAIPQILAGSHLRATAQTGTGKTAAYILPALHFLSKPSSKRGIGPRILILVPTRELAMQVAEEAKKFSKYLTKVKTVCIYGGAPYPPQKRQLSKPYEILVATPGRLIDHLDRGAIDLSRIEMFILDEADRMLDMGFIKPVDHVASLLPINTQTLMLSATFQKNVVKLSKKLLQNPFEISIVPDAPAHENIEQRIYFVDDMKHKNKILHSLLQSEPLEQCIIFTSTKRFADHLVDVLQDAGHNSASLHGDMNQRQRTRTLEGLRKGLIRILVATDVAARGIDISTISHVFNYDLPNQPEDYVHRIGRTGRAGAKGISISFAAKKEMHLVKEIEKFTAKKVPIHSVSGLEMRSKSENDAPKRRNRKPFFKKW